MNDENWLREKYGFAPSYNGTGKPPTFEEVVEYYKVNDPFVAGLIADKAQRVPKLTESSKLFIQAVKDLNEFIKDDIDHRTRLKNLETPALIAAREQNIAKQKEICAKYKTWMETYMLELKSIQDDLDKASGLIKEYFDKYIAAVQATAVIQEDYAAQAKIADQVDKTMAIGEAVLIGIITYQAVANGPKIIAGLAQAITAGIYGTANAVAKAVPG